MFVKQPNRQLQQLLAVENKILQHLKPFTLYISDSQPRLPASLLEALTDP